MTNVEHRLIATNGIQMHVAMQGSGMPVILCHGFPGLWYSWRHQLPVIAEAGFRAVAIDQRGYGRSDRPTDPAVYDMNYVMNDVLGLLDALGEKKAVLVGHDFGAPLVWNLAVRHPDRVAALIVLSVPYDFDLAGRGGAGSGQPTGAAADGKFTVDCAVPGVRPTEVFAGVARDHFIHMHYFQQIGPPEAELGGQARLFLTRLFYALSARGRLLDWRNFPTAGTGYLDVLAEPPTSPPWPWLSREDLDTYVSEYERTGPATTFIGGLNSYRNADRNWELGAPYADANVQQPTLFIAGQQDPVLQMIDPNSLDIMKRRVPNLRDIVLVPDAGHFVQQEQPAAVNAAMAKFLRSLR